MSEPRDTIRVLLVEDNPGDAFLLQETLCAPGADRFEVRHVETLEAALSLAAREPFDVALLDLALPDSHGIATVDRVMASAKRLSLIVLTGRDDEQIGLEAVRHGAQDYLVKGKVSLDLLARSIHYAIERKAAQQALQAAHDELEHKVQERTAELRVALEDAKGEVQRRLVAEEQKRQAELEAIRASELEQQRLGRDLHDSIQGSLAGMKMLIQVLGQQVRKVTPEFDEEFVALLDVTNQALAQTRGLARSLCPIDLTDDGLVLALRLLAETATGVFRIPCDFTCSTNVPPADERWATHMYYICNEAVTNAIKHAKAKRIHIRLTRQNRSLALEIEDDGVGIPAERAGASAGMGIRTMQYRASVIEATLSATKASERGGTLVRCLLPLG